jgi:hypothetical protein
MIRRCAWTVTGLLVLGVLIFGVTQLGAQRPPIGGVITFPPPAGRYVVAHIDRGDIIILDTTTGDLFRATSGDIKDYATLRRMGGRPEKDKGRFEKDKERFDKDRGRFEKDKDRFEKDKAPFDKFKDKDRFDKKEK